MTMLMRHPHPALCTTHPSTQEQQDEPETGDDQRANERCYSTRCTVGRRKLQSPHGTKSLPQAHKDRASAHTDCFNLTVGATNPVLCNNIRASLPPSNGSVDRWACLGLCRFESCTQPCTFDFESDVSRAMGTLRTNSRLD